MNKSQLQRKAPRGEKLAFINDLEAAMLKAMGGSGHVVPGTGGVRSYYYGPEGSGPGAYSDEQIQSAQNEVSLRDREGASYGGGSYQGETNESEPKGDREDSGEGRPERDPGSYGGGQGQGGRGEGEQNYGYDGGGNTTTPGTTGDWGGETSYERRLRLEAEAKAKAKAEAEAAAAEAAFVADLDNTANLATGTLDSFVENTYGSEYLPDLESSYISSYDDAKQTAYDQALAGLYDTQAGSGVWDQDAYDTSLAALEEAVKFDASAIEGMASDFSDEADADIEAWQAAQTENIMNLKEGRDKEGLDAWELDTSTLDLSRYDKPEYAEYDFLSDFKKIAPEGVSAAPETETGGEGEGEGTAPTTRKKKKKFHRGHSASTTGDGSSTTID